MNGWGIDWIRRNKFMKAGNRIKWIALGLTPMMAGFFWQILASIVVIVIYMICKRN